MRAITPPWQRAGESKFDDGQVNGGLDSGWWNVGWRWRPTNPQSLDARLAGSWSDQSAGTVRLCEFEAATAFLGIVWRR